MVRFWEQLHPQAHFSHLGILPSFLSEHDLDDARTQLDKNYRHGGGFQPFEGHTPINNYRGLKFPGDPPVAALFRCKLREEWVYFYEHSWVLVLKPDGTHVVARLD